jgi:hypothetical protein
MGFVAFAGIFIWLSNAIFNTLSYASYLYIGIGLFVSTSLGRKKHTRFLQLCFPSHQFWKVRMLENVLFILPFGIFLCYKTAFLEAIIILVGAILLSFVNHLELRSFVLQTPFGKRPFEFIIGFRNTFWVFPLLYGLTSIGIVVENFNLGIFSLLVIFGCCMSFYTTPEPIYYIWMHNKSPKEFLAEKLKTAMLYSSFLVLPVVIGLSFSFSLEKVQLTLIFFALGLGLLALTILGKYSNYPSKVPIFQMLAMLVCLIFPPLLIIVLPFFYKRAQNNLSKYLT